MSLGSNMSLELGLTTDGIGAVLDDYKNRLEEQDLRIQQHERRLEEQCLAIRQLQLENKNLQAKCK